MFTDDQFGEQGGLGKRHVPLQLPGVDRSYSMQRLSGLYGKANVDVYLPVSIFNHADDHTETYRTTHVR